MGTTHSLRIAAIVLGSGLAAAGPVGVTAQEADSHPDLQQMILVAAGDDDVAQAALDEVSSAWRNGYSGMFFDMLRFMRPPQPRSTEPEHPTTKVFQRLIRLLEEQTGERFGNDVNRWQQWIWQQPYDPHPEYGQFKGLWYGQIDPRFSEFFPPGVTSLIRLDEVDWGGVPPNGIPPMEYPAHVPAAEAEYLDDDNIVFGIAVNGEARAYPKRILAWHEMAFDKVGDLEITIVYCTLCGTVIPYESVADGQPIQFGTSGLLYRSNKLMFDDGTKSLWSTLEGVPVVGRLAGSGLQLTRRSMVTTTWEEWRTRHPETTVLSIETGFERDYAEGAAYRDYFSTDQLMFQVQASDDRLDNKDEVVTLFIDDPAGGARHPVALSADFLEDHPVFQTEVAGQTFVVVTSPDGANRVFSTSGQQFERRLDDFRVADSEGRVWQVTEDELVAEDDAAVRLERLPANRAFWFGWYAQFPQTELFMD
jgi:hypothetical protein